MAKQKSYWVRSGKFTLLQRLSMLTFGVGTFYLLVRTLDKEGYGTWMLFITVTALLDTARNGFLKNPLIRFLNKVDKDEKRSLQASSFVMNILFSVVTGGVLVAIAGLLADAWDSPEIQLLFYIYFITNLFYAVFYHCDYIQAANFRFGGPFIGGFLKSGVFFAAVVFFYFTDYQADVILLSYCYLAAALVGAAAMLIASRDLIDFKLGLKKKWIKELFGYGKYTLGTNISAVFIRNIDVWMLGYYMTPAAVAVYNVAIRIANLFEVPLMALASVMFPQAVKKAEDEGESALKELYERSVSLILVLTAPFVLLVIIFSEQIVWLLAGDGYEETAVILNITMLYGLIIPFNKQMGILLDAIGKAKLNMLFVARNAIINGILNAIMIPYFGTIGAAYATGSTMLISLLINQIFLHRNFSIKLRNLWGYGRYYVKDIPKKAKNFREYL